jgi:subtilase family serine protease
MEEQGELLMKSRTRSFSLLIVILFLTVCFSTMALAGPTAGVRLRGHVPFFAMSKARHMGRAAKNKQVSLTVVLSLRNQAELTDLINRLSNPLDALYGQYLTPEEFKARFSPTADDIASVVQYLVSKNLVMSESTSNTIKVTGSVRNIEKAFNLEMHQYTDSKSRITFAPNNDPEVSNPMAGKIVGVLGLNNFTTFVAHRHRRLNSNGAAPIGSGPNGGLSPSDIQKAYSVTVGSNNGAGQTLALMELDGYAASDISTYSSQFGLPQTPTLQNVLVDGYDGSAGQGADEVTLDIELMMAVSPGPSKILVYEGVNNETGPLDVYSKIADDNLAKQVSTSWGSPENQNTDASLQAENTVFMQFAAQGQSLYAAAGDAGAYDDGSTLSVDDPASQPYVTATGGTTLAINSDGTFKSESSWGLTNQGQSQGGGGGISGKWPLPSYQTGLSSASNNGSSSNRMVPDISLDANPQTGYAIYVGGSWNVYGGTSCAAPLWAGFTALINQRRVNTGQPVLGFANIPIYQAAQSTSYSQLFHDVTDQSTNLFYPAVTGYDLSTGWGSLNVSALVTALSGATN